MFQTIAYYCGVGENPEKLQGKKRSGHWPAVRDAHLKKEPVCQVCGGTDRLNVHHVVPFHLDQSKECDPANLVTLCEAKGHNCHLIFGHLLSFKSFNRHVRRDAEEWSKRIRQRPAA